MSQHTTFKTRARLIDHLGRGQIADAPTAISELWKNSYDAYARNVSLHIFDDNPCIAALYDDGAGMGIDDVLNRWLVIGTESKTLDRKQTEEKRFGLKQRAIQGEKGIGRLSAAFLAPVTLLVSKKQNEKFVAALVDWRAFENPLASVEDIAVAVREFEKQDDLFSLLPDMREAVCSNFFDERGEARDIWNSDNTVVNQLLARIAETYETPIAIEKKHFDHWSVFNGESKHGTAILLLDTVYDLSVWVETETTLHSENPKRIESDTDVHTKDNLRFTLRAFTDPYTREDLEFNYSAHIHIGVQNKQIINREHVFNLDKLRTLEHYIIGNFDESGMFRADEVVAFGKPQGDYTLPPPFPLPAGGRKYLGAFSFCFGTYEGEYSSHAPEMKKELDDQASKFGGLCVYRDGLRVLPFGRPENDFFEIEERRQKNAGQYFWARRRGFGRVAISHDDNPNLKDKAGREGITSNEASRYFKALVVNLLIDSAEKFYGRKSKLREPELEILKAQRQAEKEAEAAEKQRQKELRDFKKRVRSGYPELCEIVKNYAKKSEALLNQPMTRENVNELARFEEDYRQQISKFRLRSAPRKLETFEVNYRQYRDAFTELGNQLDAFARAYKETLAKFADEDPEAKLQTFIERRHQQLLAKLRSYQKGLTANLETVSDMWSTNFNEDKASIVARITKFSDIKNANLEDTLNIIDYEYSLIDEELDFKYQPTISVLKELSEGTDVFNAMTGGLNKIRHMEDTLIKLQGVSQAGISMEIAFHELEALDNQIVENLRNLDEVARSNPNYKSALEAYEALIERIRFLSKLNFGGKKLRRKITGEEIYDYVREFFRNHLKNTGIKLTASDAFKQFEIEENYSLIFPVFINLVNNALYWVKDSEKKQITFEYRDKKVLVADTGKGVDKDDIEDIFELFFTRRSDGRGVGLYLCKAILGSAGHKLYYLPGDEPKVLSGANFVIQFNS